MRMARDGFANLNRKEVILCTPRLSRRSRWPCCPSPELWLAVAEATVVVVLVAATAAPAAVAALAVAAALDAEAIAAAAAAASSLHVTDSAITKSVV